MQLSRSRRVARRISKWNRLRNRGRALAVADCSRSRPALIVRTIDVRRDEEKDFAVLPRRQFSLEEIADDRNRSESGSALLSFTFGVGEHAAHDGRATIRNQHFRLHALRIDTRNTANCDTGVEGVVFNRDSQHNRAGIGDLRRD